MDERDLRIVAVVVAHHLAHRPLDLPIRGICGMLPKDAARKLALKHAAIDPMPAEEDF